MDGTCAGEYRFARAHARALAWTLVGLIDGGASQGDAVT
jgi:hypothetical protein